MCGRDKFTATDQAKVLKEQIKTKKYGDCKREWKTFECICCPNHCKVKVHGMWRKVK